MDADRLNPANQPRLVAALAYDGLCLFEFAIAAEIFGLPRPEIGQNWYRFMPVAAERGIRSGIGHLALRQASGLQALSQAHTVIVPGWKGVDAFPSDELRDALISARDAGARILSICSGAFLLGHCGLLDGKKAVTHWRYEEAFRARFPAARLVSDVLYVDEGNIVTSAGSAAGIDACLHLVRNDFGAFVANQVAKRLVLPSHRDGGRRQFVPRPVPPRNYAKFNEVFDWARQRLGSGITAADMARAAAMSERNFYRRFGETTGKTPADWLREERISCARELLEKTDLSLDRIAQKLGIGSTETFRALFRRSVGVPPGSYRRRFAARP